MIRLTWVAALCVGSIAMAQEPVSALPEGPWRMTAGRAELPAAKLSFPTSIGGLTLVRTGESTEKGSGLDDFAQFESVDRKVFATIYIYRTTYPDAALAAYATDRVIRRRFVGATLAAQDVAAVDGRPGTAIRSIYRQGIYEGAPVTTTAAFTRLGEWVLKLRVTGPADRDAEVTTALASMIAALRVDRAVTIPAAMPIVFDAPCPVTEKREAKVRRDKDANADSLFGGLLASVPAKPDATLPFPANGATRACVVGALAPGEAAMQIIRPAGAPNGTMLVTMNDAGTVMSIEPTLLPGGYSVKTYTVGAVEVRGTLDRQPTPAQLARWLTRGGNALRIRSRTVVRPDGGTTINIDSKSLR